MPPRHGEALASVSLFVVMQVIVEELEEIDKIMKVAGNIIAKTVY